MITEKTKELARKLKELHGKTTAGPWILKTFPDGSVSYIEAPEPKDRNWGYGIEVFGEDTNGYPTWRNDMEFTIAAHELLPELLNTILADGEGCESGL